MDESSTQKPEEEVSEASESEETKQEDVTPEAGAPEEPGPDLPIPPATFPFLVLSLRSQVEMHLGLLHFGDEKDRPKPNLPFARHAIDLMAMLQEKTKGNLSLEETRLLENSLTELRFRFVQFSESSNT